MNKLDLNAFEYPAPAVQKTLVWHKNDDAQLIIRTAILTFYTMYKTLV